MKFAIFNSKLRLRREKSSRAGRKRQLRKIIGETVWKALLMIAKPPNTRYNRNRADTVAPQKMEAAQFMTTRFITMESRVAVKTNTNGAVARRRRGGLGKSLIAIFLLKCKILKSEIAIMKGLLAWKICFSCSRR